MDCMVVEPPILTTLSHVLFPLRRFNSSPLYVISKANSIKLSATSHLHTHLVINTSEDGRKVVSYCF